MTKHKYPSKVGDIIVPLDVAFDGIPWRHTDMGAYCVEDMRTNQSPDYDHLEETERSVTRLRRLSDNSIHVGTHWVGRFRVI
jgi:hypothetical protein